MVIWSGWGILAFLVYVACCMLVDWAIMGNSLIPEVLQTSYGVSVLSLIVAGFPNVLLGRFLNKEENRHRIFYLPVQYAGWVAVAVGIILTTIELAM